MPAPAPLFSVVVACRNPGPRLHTALESVRAQRDASWELVVVDGASTDGTREWLETWLPPFGTLVSEPDRGVYDAMNKGVVCARGEWILFLGADDRLADDGALARAAVALATTEAEVFVGEARYDDGRRYSLADATHAIRRNFVHHQAAFYRRSLLARYGAFDLSFRIQGDYDFNLRLLRAGVRFAAQPLPVSRCGAGGLSDGGQWANYREEIAARHRHFPAGRCWLWDLGSVARWLRKQFVRSRDSHG